MAVPLIRGTLLATTTAVALGAALYEHHEPFRHWADDVCGRAEAAWVGLKSDIKEFQDDVREEGRRRRHAWGTRRASQWEGADIEVQGPWRRRRRSRPAEASEGNSTGTAANEQSGGNTVRRRRGSMTPHEQQLNPETIAASAIEEEEILHNDPDETGSRASTDTLRSAEEITHGSAMLTPTSTLDAESVDVDNDAASISGMSTPSEMQEVIETRSVSDMSAANDVEGVLTPVGSGILTPTSSTADELIDFNELRSESGTDGASEEIMEDARSEVSGVSEWSRISEASVPLGR